MDFEEYSDEEIESIKIVLTNYLDKFGIQKTLDLLIGIGDTEFWKNYENQNGDNPFVNVIEYDEQEENDDEIRKMNSENAQKVWKVFSNDSGAQEIIADAIDDIEYDPADNLLRMNTVNAVFSTVNLLATAEDKGSDKLYDAVRNKMYDLEDLDFCTVYQNVDAQYFFENQNFSSIILDKIKNMETKNFIYFILTTQEIIDINNKTIVNAIKSKVESLDDPFVNNVYKSLKNIVMPKASISKEKLSRVDKLLDGIEDEKEELKVFSSLSDSEMIKFLLNYENKEELVDPKILNSKEFSKRLKETSDENIVLLLNAFSDIYAYSLELEENDETRQTKKSGLQWEPIIKEAQRRKMITDEFEIDCTEECLEKMIQLHRLYDISKNIWEVPFSYEIFTKNSEEEYEDEEDYEEDYEDDFEINEDNEEEQKLIDYLPEESKQNKDEYDSNDDYDQDYDDEYEDVENENEIIFDSYKRVDKKLAEFIELYDYVDKMEQLPDLKMLHIINHYNVKNKAKPANEIKETQIYFENYLRSKIFDMPTAYASFFQVIDEGALNDAMEVKAEEMQHHILYDQNIEEDER